jgi:DNA polymerase II small subunit/DNA polymerase delta subunit B
MKSEMVRRALEAGLLLTPDILETLDEKALDRMISEASGKGRTVLSDRGRQKSNLVIKVRRAQPKNRLSPEDFVKYYNNKYEGIRKMLLKRLDAVSISNARESYSSVAVIGMVRELRHNGVLLEDTTGEIDVVIEDGPNVDDVIGVKGVVREGKIIGNELVFPDISLSNTPKRIKDTRILLATALTAETRKLMESADFVLIPETSGMSERDEKRIVTNFTNPTWINISGSGKPENEMNILVYRPHGEATREQAIEFLKKRHLSPNRSSITSPEDIFLIDPAPDIFWMVSKSTFSENYKGVTIVSSEGPGAVLVDLETREVEFKKV